MDCLTQKTFGLGAPAQLFSEREAESSLIVTQRFGVSIGPFYQTRISHSAWDWRTAYRRI
jgi:hypothetical protein